MPTLSTLYGIATTRNAEGRPIASLDIGNEHLNWYGSAYGGCYILAANTVAQETIGYGPVGGMYHFKFFKQIACSQQLCAKARVTREGGLLISSEATIFANDQLAGTMQADYYRNQKQLMLYAGVWPNKKLPPPCDFVLNTQEDPTRAQYGYTFPQMLCGISQKGKAEKTELGGSARVGLYTNENFADANGFIDPSLLGILADNALGVVCWSKTEASVTIDLSLNVLARVTPGAFMSCSSQIVRESGLLMAAQGILWANEEPIGICSGTYYRIPNT